MLRDHFQFIQRGGLLLASLLLLTSLFTLTSCSDDDENGGISETAAFDSYAAKYEITSAGSPYSSIELTEAGNYIISFEEAASRINPLILNLKGKDATSLTQSLIAAIHHHQTTRATPYSPILYGRYTVNEDGSYNLAGFGTITVEEDNNGHAVELVITRNGQEAESYHASIQSSDIHSSMSNKLCRTWAMAHYRYLVKLNGSKVCDFQAGSLKELFKKILQWGESQGEDIDPEDYEMLEVLNEVEPKTMVFTKTGTYLVEYTNSQVAVSTWRWLDESAGLLVYSWNNNLENLTGVMNGQTIVSIKGSQLTLVEKTSESEDGYTLETSMTYTLNEAK